MQKVFLAADHAGFDVKAKIAAYLTELAYDVKDFGAYAYRLEDDYPDFVTPCAQAVASTFDARGIIFGGSGQGEAMCANRIPGVRAAVFYGASPHLQTDALGNVLDMITSAREHNNANVLAIGARFLSEQEIKRAVQLFLSTPFSEVPRHVRRLAKF